MEINIPVLTGTYFDLSKFDFSFKGLKIFDIQNPEFKDYILSLSKESIYKDQVFNFFNDLIKSIRYDHDKKFAIVKINPNENFNYKEIENVWKILLIIFPSDIQISNIIHYYETKDVGGSYMTAFEKRETGEYPGNLLLSDDKDVAEINEFIVKAFDKLNQHKSYIGLVIENYLISFHASHSHYKYLNLCMALESTVHGSEEVSYKLRRNIAVLCGSDYYNCELIHDNIKKIYALRSKIIHGEEIDFEKVEQYTPAITALVSRSIIELLTHNISSREELNKILTGLGYGDREKISTDWKHYKLNISTVVESNWKKMPSSQLLSFSNLIKQHENLQVLCMTQQHVHLQIRKVGKLLNL